MLELSNVLNKLMYIALSFLTVCGLPVAILWITNNLYTYGLVSELSGSGDRESSYWPLVDVWVNWPICYKCFFSLTYPFILLYRMIIVRNYSQVNRMTGLLTVQIIYLVRDSELNTHSLIRLTLPSLSVDTNNTFTIRFNIYLKSAVY